MLHVSFEDVAPLPPPPPPPAPVVEDNIKDKSKSKRNKKGAKMDQLKSSDEEVNRILEFDAIAQIAEDCKDGIHLCKVINRLIRLPVFFQC